MKLLLSLSQSLKFVPNCSKPPVDDVKKLEEFVKQSCKLMVITGAGVSTESGIPDYRSDTVGLYARTSRRPMSYQEFVKSEKGRQRYWARNFVGWPTFSSFRPNITHTVLCQWECDGHLDWLVTQNVDALHTKTGSTRLTELHGCLHRARCLQCNNVIKRHDLQVMFIDLNPHFKPEHAELAPDGDVLLTEEQVRGFQVPACSQCGGVLTPDIVFFGDNVASSLVQFVYSKVDDCDRVLVLGSSLQVFSSFRFVRRAYDQQKPIAAVNIGPTRADKYFSIKVNGQCGEVLPMVQLHS